MSLSLSRGIDTLCLINDLSAVLPSDVARHLSIPRATVYRILQTLVEKGLVYQHEGDRRFRMTMKVNSLSSGFGFEDYLAEISRPLLNELTEHFIWPTAFVTIEGNDLIIRENTDYRSPLAIEQFDIGFRMSVLDSASGQCILAFMEPAEREEVLIRLKSKVANEQSMCKYLQSIEQVRLRGYAIHHRQRKYHRQRKASDITAIAVPIVCKNHSVTAMTLRYARTAVSQDLAIKEFLPLLYEKSKQLVHQADS